MKTVRTAFVPLALVLLSAPAVGQLGALPGSPGSRASAVDSASDKLGEMSRYLAGSREKPERAVKVWDGLTAELWEAWREGKPPAGKGGASVDRAAKPHDAFLSEWTTTGRELLVYRQGLVQRTEGLQAAIDAFPGRRSEWLTRLDDASKRMSLGEKALSEPAPKAPMVQEALVRVGGAKNVAVNVAADTQALRDQVQREYGKKEAMPSGVTGFLARFSKAPELHPSVPETWKRAMLDGAASVRRAYELNGSTRAKYDTTYAALVQQQLFEPVGRFKGIAYKDLPGPPMKLEADLRALLKKLGETKVTAEDLEKEKQRNATECAARYADLQTNNASTKRALDLGIARTCGASACREAMLEAARSPCSAEDMREMQLRYARAAGKRLERQQALRATLEVELASNSKTFTAERRLSLLAEIEALNSPSAAEEDLGRLIQARQKGTDPACAVENEAAARKCDWFGPDCSSARAPLEAELKALEERDRAMGRLTRDREKRRKALGLPSDTLWQDCPGR